ncbi:hypothetical protein ES703_17597 [subsurface metagenome]
MVKMDLKKILALAMLALMAIPSLTMVVRADEPYEGAGPAGAIERARIYLNKVMTSAEKTAALYPNDTNMQGYLNQLNALLGQYEYEGPEFLLQSENGVAERSDVESYGGNYSVHLETTGDKGNESRIVIPMPEGFTLGELETLSWWEYLVAGYPPHVDVILDLDGNTVYDDGTFDDALVFEYAYNTLDHYAEAPMPYGALTGEWYQTFNDDDKGPAVIDNSSMAWATKGASGPPPLGGNFFFYSLADWKEGVTYTAEGYNEKTINSDSIVLRLEIELDNWVVQTEAYVDDIKIDGTPYAYDFEEKEAEDGKAKDYLDQASASLVKGDIRSAARSLASARNIIGRVNGLLKSMAKVHKVARTEKFQRRIQGIEDKIARPKGPKK